MDTSREKPPAGDIVARLLELQQGAAPLQLDSQTRRAALAKVAEFTESFIERSAKQAVYQPAPAAADSLAALRITGQPDTIESALDILHEHVSSTGQAIVSDRFFAYIPSGGIYPSALADFIAAVINRYAGVGYAGPGAARLEQSLVNWLVDLTGYPETAEGDLTSGGSMATLSAVVTAREAHGIGSAKVSRSVVYLTPQMHHTFAKALRIAGMGDCVLRQVPMTGELRMNVAELEHAIAADRDAGLTPWLVATSAGSTDVGAVDPLDDIADVARAAGVWFHVDAAYGGAFLLCKDGKTRLAGLEKSDSLVLDPHKGFFLPSGTGAVLVRDGQKMRNAFRARGVYMQDIEDDTERSACDLSPELTRPFRGLRFWLPLKLLGVAPFRAALEEKLLLARYFRDCMRDEEHCELGPGPDLSVVTFRYLPSGHDPDAFNRRLVKEIQDDARVFLTSTTIDGRYTIRMAILGFNTHLESVDTAIAVIREKVALLLSR
ncbi:MAG: aminotransferase class V-fold PLP-dependent enzyme [Gammaproteobacteria bacterium]|nr:aminotransferase class V-fold PLP-dependent enzyme [Gammaproteobacteria bacterium]